jgi:sulfide dehydrogenase [flavocytochrome c] flavoprotein subunit
VEVESFARVKVLDGERADVECGVIGGGFGGPIAAKYIRMMDKSIEGVLIERNDHFVSCPFSNLYIGGILTDMGALTIKLREW